jgi:hypothetical protein
MDKYHIFYSAEKISGVITGSSRGDWNYAQTRDTLDEVNNFIKNIESNDRYSSNYKYHFMVIKGVVLKRDVEETQVEEVVVKKITIEKDFFEE